MCNGYPSLRCSRHAKNLLNAAEEKLDAATTWEEKEEANKIHQHALKVFYTTPAGFKELEEKIKTTNNDLRKDELYSLLFEGKKVRREARSESLRIQRENKDKIARSALMRKTGLPWWVIASQLNVEFLENLHDTKLINSNGVIDSNEKHDTYSIDLKTQSFTISIHDSEGKEIKYLSISNHHSHSIYDEAKKFTTNKNIFSITKYYSSRGENKPIESSELLSAQKRQVLDAVKSSIEKDAIDKIIVSDPKIGFSRVFSIDDIEENFDVTLYTPLSLHNGTDPMTDKAFERFVELYDKSLFVKEPAKIDNRYIVESVKELSKDERSSDGFILIPLKENVYEIKKAGNVRGVSIRVLLTLVKA